MSTQSSLMKHPHAHPAAAVVVLSLTMGTAPAATIVVDEVRCTLIDAIEAADRNSAAGGCRAGDDLSDGGDHIDLISDVSWL